MSKQVEIRVLKLVDVDPFESSVPFVRITAPSGETKTSATGQVEKDKSKYSFGEDLVDNLLLFVGDGYVNLIKFSVAVFSKDSNTGQITQYPGVGTINIFVDDANNDNSEVHCPLYEDGDEMLEIGALVYTYNIADAPGADLEDLDFNAASLEPSPRVEVIAEPEPKEIAPYDDGMDAFEREMMKEENMEEFLNDEAEDDLYDIGSIGPNEELIVAPELHIHPEHAHLDHTHHHDSPTKVVPNVVHEVTLLPVPAAPKPVDMWDWMRVAEEAENIAISDTIRADLVKAGPQCSKIVIRLHSVIISSQRTLDTTSATAKLSVLPLPNKVVSLRSVTNKGEDAGASPVQAISGKGTSTTFSFGLKTAQLSMGAGDLRSKTFREGACPRLSLEIALGGGEPYTAFTELYLPALLSDCSGQVLSVPLVSTVRTDGDHTSAAITSTLLFELNPADMITTSSAETYTPTRQANVTTTATSPGKKTKTNKNQPLEEKTGLIPDIPAAMNVQLELSGILGAALETFPTLSATASLEAYLTSSGATETVSLSSLATIKNSASALSIKKTFSMHCVRPKVDILQLRLRNGPFPEDEIGRICIPLVALLQVGSEDLVLNKVLSFNAWKFSNSDKGGAYLLGNWKLVGALRYQAVGTSASAKTAATATNATTGEFDGSFSPAQTGFPLSALTNTENGTGNWMSSPTRRSPGFGSQAMGGTAVPSSAKPSLVKSVSGQLVVCVKGYFSARSAGLDATGNQDAHEREGPIFLSKGYSLFVETTLMPEGLRKRTAPASASVIQSGDIDATVEWNKSFSMFLAYAAQQVHAVCSVSTHCYIVVENKSNILLCFFFSAAPGAVLAHEPGR